MKKFMLNVGAFILLVGTLYTLLAVSVSYKSQTDQSNSYMAAMMDKHTRARLIKGPKIIFVGGSNLAFGLNSEEVERTFSIPVVNLGLHAGLGLEFILNEAKETMKNGDVVFLSIEYQLDNEGSYELKKNTSSIFSEAKKYYDFNIKNEIISNLDKTRNNIKSFSFRTPKASEKKPIPKSEVYTRAAFNAFGDHIGHIGKPSPEKLADRAIMNYYKWPAIDLINEFYQVAQSKNVTVFFLFPNFPESEFKKNRVVISRFADDVKTNLKAEQVNSPADLVLADSLFYDTVYHLNGTGRNLRTQKLIELMKANKSVMMAIAHIQKSK